MQVGRLGAAGGNEPRGADCRRSRKDAAEIDLFLSEINDGAGAARVEVTVRTIKMSSDFGMPRGSRRLPWHRLARHRMASVRDLGTPRQSRTQTAFRHALR